MYLAFLLYIHEDGHTVGGNIWWSLGISTNFRIHVCMYWYHYCMYWNNSWFMNHVILY